MTGVPEVPTARRRGLLVRLTVAPAILAVVVGIFWWHDRAGTSAPTDVVLALLATGAAWEAAAMLRTAGKDPARWAPVVFSAALAGLGLLAPHDPGARGLARSAILAAAVLVVFAGHLRAVRPGDLDRVLATLFPVVYVGYLFGLLREVGDGPEGARRMAFVVVASKASDIGGWVVGKAVGRHKMIPAVSPGKTWEGAAGGLAFSVGAALLVLAVTGPLEGLVAGPAEAATLGLVLGVASIVGGLTQSALKRRCGVKDSSTLLPEMGGLLDMVDSLLLAAPVAMLWPLVR